MQRGFFQQPVLQSMQHHCLAPVRLHRLLTVLDLIWLLRVKGKLTLENRLHST